MVTPRSVRAVALPASVAGLVWPVNAQEVSKLSTFQPLTVQDAYPTKNGTVVLETSGIYDRTSTDKDRGEVRPRVKWGVFEGLQLSTTVPYRFGNSSERDTGEVEVGGLYQFNKDRNGLPAFAVAANVSPFFGRTRGTETDLTFIATKSLTGSEDGPSLHLNASWRHIIDGSSTDRQDRYLAVVGYSHPLSQETALLVDFVREQRRERGTYSNLVEIGIRHKLAEDLVLSGGVGAGIGDASPKLRVIMGLQKSFVLD